jgi:hypothetical protein
VGLDQAHVFFGGFRGVLGIDEEEFLLQLFLHKQWKNENVSTEECSKQKAKSIVTVC